MAPLYPPDDRPKGVQIPKYHSNQPLPETPPEVRTFFGKAGKWWGTWKSPQTKGSYDAVLLIQEIYRQEDRWEAKVLYATAGYPKWYIEGSAWEKVGTFTRRPDGKTILSVRHPSAGVMEFWFEKNKLLGKLSMRFMLSLITLKPLL